MEGVPVSIANISAVSARISWQPVNSSLVSGYMINISNGCNKHYLSKITSASHLFLTELQPQTEYNVTVSVLTYDRQTAAAQSEPVTFVTRNGMHFQLIFRPPSRMTGCLLGRIRIQSSSTQSCCQRGSPSKFCSYFMGASHPYRRQRHWL